MLDFMKGHGGLVWALHE